MDVLNSRYADTPFLFRWVNSDPAEAQVAVQNSNVFFFEGDFYRSNDYATAKHVGDARTLNVYLLYRICGHPFIWLESNCYTIGAATNPSYQLGNTADGIYLSYDTLAGGGFEGYDTGISLLHEVGHWLGLLHVFESETSSLSSSSSSSPIHPDSNADPCDPINALNGDYVDDTPFLPEPSLSMYECSLTFYEGEDEEVPNSCPNLPGVDPVFNYMNYVGSEHCLPEGTGEFTRGQIERMYKQFILYREHGDDCAQNEMRLNLTMKLDVDHAGLHVEIAPIDGQAVFNLARDMHTCTSLLDEMEGNQTRELNFCVPSSVEYVFAVTDTGRNGFDDAAFVELSVNGEIMQRVDGDFGSTECLRFGNKGKLADLATPEADFGTYQYEVPENNTVVRCAASTETFLREPVGIMKDRYMRVNVSLQQQKTRESASMTSLDWTLALTVQLLLCIQETTRSL